MALTGDLSNFSFVDIFQVLLQGKKSGILLVEWKDLTCAYYVKDGDVIFARPVDKVFRVYTDRDFDQLLVKLRIDPKSMPRTVERFLVGRFHLKEGIFSFTPGFIKYGSSYPVEYRTPQLLLMASRELSPEEVERKISDELMLLEKLPSAEETVGQLPLTPEEKKVWNLIDGVKTVAQIRAESGLPNLTVDRALYAFMALGVVKRKKKETQQYKPSITLELLAKIIERIRGL
ncbi:hypothetical protein Thal_0485 [Thermocrinis albus DSM 14484]|uniref:PatA-like N-terminal domain-containing protein n=1 Tax=Thermocrinis albus (strain DSM 14484 / JCM 11386 / HI 11/12) TaxID=638303 RepID=D3SPN2_THEAH|nr:DUF4388 domain-containing protein [Thermocrinis albus]ADC89119.1 hypothetical protein Thal_0485 [Thermocrinis albus DSM 14484]